MSRATKEPKDLMPKSKKAPKSTGEEGETQNPAGNPDRRAQDPVSSDGQANDADRAPTAKQAKIKGVKEVWFAGSHSNM